MTNLHASFDSTQPDPALFAGEYTLLDSGNASKLEQLGPYRLIRPAPQAIWHPRLPRSEWDQAHAIYERSSSGGGSWHWQRKVSREFDVLFSNLSFRIKLTNFGHLGLFPEQAINWGWLRENIRERLQRTNYRNLHVLNLFAYTGGSTLAASQAGAHVVHVDAAKGVVDWARRNARQCHLDERPIRWLVDDALKFVKREIRRGNRYQGIILDPPSFGRGPKGEVFKIEDDLLPLLEACRELLARDALFVLYSCHTPGFTPIVLANQLADVVGERGGSLEHGEMVIPDSTGRLLPSGTYARWLADS
ncbi:class I SAM-dependent methyltransferase [Litorilinea aerophila]|uniref:S-adenosylmethionine-dependent methyltransferase domain-containing protein n=1 Tax=Litorilinea aerophila TaxID=1204385 RepID=A0A540VK25_9CHLR|nr:class I SAM-dependent methyltransferase [Litorilinea aerophila]MCC9075198.1 class I SAM-dependent methyltransferase [Litorilinea aerophila]GIV78331.1 MAG: SAM-dependent methyltransferase [Litorilinea sp.]